MWQTETSGPVFGNPYGLGMLPIKPGSATIPLPGIDAAVVTPDGKPCAPGEKGIMVLKRPFPGLIAGLWGEPERYGRDYWEKIPGVYYTGDSAHIDEDGYVWFGGRADEIIKIAGHRIGTIEVESACLKHPVRRRVRRHRPSRRDARRGDLGVRAAEARARAVGGAAQGAARHDPPRARSGRRHRRAELRRACCRRRAAARSCAACSRRSPSIAIPATSRPSRTKDRSTKRATHGSR